MKSAYYRARFYDAGLGRFVGRDPIGYSSNLSLYCYCASTPSVSIDPYGLEHFDVVGKSFINGIPRVGRIQDTPGIFNYWDIRWDSVDSIDWVATERLELLASLVGHLTAFNQNPSNNARDQSYRLYSRATFDVDCSESDCAVLKSLEWDADGGVEIAGNELYNVMLGLADAAGYDTGLARQPYIPGQDIPYIFGTINLDGGFGGGPTPKAFRAGKSVVLRWRAYGRPNLAVEPGMQYVAPRLSFNIWHDVEAWITCAGGTPTVEVKVFDGSRFPSHRLWVNNTVVKDIGQGSYSDLWISKPGYVFFVE